MTHGPHPRTGEARRGHAHNREDVPVQTDLVTDDVGPAGEARLPQLAADDDDGMPAWRHVVGAREESPAIGGDAEDVEEVAGDEIAEGAVRAVAGVQAGDESGPGRHAVKRLSAVAERGVHRIREDAGVLLPLHVDQPIAVGHRQALQEGGIDDGEDSGVGADAERQGKNRRQRECAILAEQSEGEAQILKQSFHLAAA